MKPVLSQTIQRIEGAIESGRYRGRLPSLRVLSTQHNASVVTVARALKALALKGVISVRQGRRAEIRTPKGHLLVEAYPQTAGEQLAHTLARKIATGVFASGERLPKLDYFVKEYKVSNHTVRAALELLVKQGIVHRRSRHYVVGKRPSPVTFSEYTFKPVVVILTPHFERWFWAAQHFRHGSLFYTAFVQELEKRGMRVDVAFLDPDPRREDYVSGAPSVVRHIRNLGKRYAGCLFFANSRSYLINHARHLARCGGTVVWHNIFQTPLPFDREVPRPGNFRWSYRNELHGIQLCVRHLYEKGHRRIGVPLFSTGLPNHQKRWMRERLQRIVADAAANYPEMCIYPAQQRGSFRSFTAGDAPHFKVFDPQPEARTSRTQIHSIQRESSLLSTAPSLYELLHRKEVTALIALNDAYAADFMHRIRAAGMRVPEDVSLVSFDNSLQSQLLHLTSVDFNAQLHGYLLAHLFIKDIPVATTPNGEVPIGSFLSDRNSVVSIH